MSLFDKAKGLAGKAQGAAGKAKQVAREHSDQLEQGIAKAGGLADKATKGKYSDRIAGATDKARDAVQRLDEGGGPAGPAEPGR